jgi:hypothetical protein
MSLSEVSGSGDTDRSLTLTAARQSTSRLHNFSLFLYSAMSTGNGYFIQAQSYKKEVEE